MSAPDFDRFLAPFDHPALLPWMTHQWAAHRFARGLSLPGGQGDRHPVERLFVPPPARVDGQPVRPEDALRERGRVVLIGESAAGKSFFLRALVHGLCTRGYGEWHRRLGALVPLPLGAEELMAPAEGEGEGLALLLALLRRLPGWTADQEQVLPELLASGQALFVLDGWDEVDDPDRRALLSLALAELAERHPRVGVLLASRRWVWEESPVEGFAEVALGPFRGREREQWSRLAEWREGGLPALPVGLPEELLLPGRLVLLALLVAEGERFLPATWFELLDRAHDRLLLAWFDGAAPVSLRRRWLEALALRLHRARVWGRAPRRLAREEARRVLQAEERGGLPGGEEVEAFLDAGLRPGGLLVEEGGAGIGFVHLDHQDRFAAGALARRLLGRGWMEPEDAQQLADEIARMALRSGGFGAVALLFEQLRREQPELGDQLAVEVFRRRGAAPEALRRLVGLAQRLDHADLVAWARS